MYYIALKMLIGDRGKFIGIIVGISFASLIMTQQPGVFVGLMTRSYSFITDIALPDIWVMDPKIRYIDDVKTFPTTMLYRVASIEGIKWAKPLYKGNIQARLKNGNYQNCVVVGLDDTTLIGGPAKMIEGKVEHLRQSDSVIVSLEGAVDKLANPPDHPGGKPVPLKIGEVLEVNDHRAVVVGIAETTRSFQSIPIVFTTFSRATQFAPPVRNFLSFILVKAKDPKNIPSVCQKIKEKTGLSAYTSEQFKDLCIDYLMKYTGIPINFGVSVLLGFLVGAAIAGQTFFNFTIENLRYFGVLKAMGTKNRTLLFMIVFQALLVGLIGYGLGLGLTAIFNYTTQDTAIAFRFPWQLFVFSITGVTIICGISAILSIWKVMRLEPAIVFKS